MKDTRICDLCVGLGFIAAGAVVLNLAGELQKMPRGIGPAGYPTVVAALMIVLGGAQAVRSLAGGWPGFSFAPDYRAAVKVLAVIVVAFAYVWLVRYLGFLILTPFLLFFLMYLFNYRKYAKAALASVGVSVCTWVVFAKIFQIFLPACTLF